MKRALNPPLPTFAFLSLRKTFVLASVGVLIGFALVLVNRLPVS